MLLIPCAEVTRLISPSLDRKLPLPLRIIVRIHIFRCKTCQRFRQQSFFLKNIMHRYSARAERAELSPSTLSPEAHERIKHFPRHPDQ